MDREIWSFVACEDFGCLGMVSTVTTPAHTHQSDWLKIAISGNCFHELSHSIFADAFQLCASCEAGTGELACLLALWACLRVARVVV